jgi:hypothetical protein
MITAAVRIRQNFVLVTMSDLLSIAVGKQDVDGTLSGFG